MLRPLQHRLMAMELLLAMAIKQVRRFSTPCKACLVYLNSNMEWVKFKAFSIKCRLYTLVEK